MAKQCPKCKRQNALDYDSNRWICVWVDCNYIENNIIEEPTEPNPFEVFFKILSESMHIFGKLFGILAEVAKEEYNKLLLEDKKDV